MYLTMLDWAIVSSLLVVMFVAAVRTKKYTRTVADFLAANRCAGRYVLGVSEGIASVGAISLVAIFEAYFQAGFSFIWWSWVTLTVTVVVSMTGWVQYRYRQTRAFTMAQFFEMRYSRRFRILAGIILFVSGTVNFAIFPAVGARFFMYFCGLNPNVINLGFLQIDLTYLLTIMVLLGIALFFTFMGGQIAVMVTDFIQGTFFNFAMCGVVLFLLIKIPWSTCVEALKMAPANMSMLNPMKSSSTEFFNPWYYIIHGFGMFFTFMAWQGNQGYYSSAINAHEARMGRVLGAWRTFTQTSILPILAISSFVVLKHSSFIDVADKVRMVLSGIGDDTIRNQVTCTVVLSKFLPLGLLGLFCAVVLAAFISTHDTYLHSWGSIFIQDVVLPLKQNKSVSKEDHLKMLRLSIIGVAVFIFLFSLFFSQKTYILMFFAMTGNLWLGGAGAVIVGGLYWKRGTTQGAYASVILAVIMTLVYFISKSFGFDWTINGFKVNEQWLWFFTMLSTLSVYVTVSLITCKVPMNMDKLLHRGVYAVKSEDVSRKATVTSKWQRKFGINSDFSFRDKVTYFAVLCCILVLVAIFIVGTLLCIVTNKVTEDHWTSFWHFYVWAVLGICSFTTVWYLLGGLKDLRAMLSRLKSMDLDDTDDGTVDDEIQKDRLECCSE